MSLDAPDRFTVEQLILLRQIQNALILAFCDPRADVFTPSLEDYATVDWVGMIQEARRRLDALQARVALADDLFAGKLQEVLDRLEPLLKKIPPA